MPGSPYAVLKYWLEKVIKWKGQLSKQNGDWKTSNEIHLPAGAIDISVYLKKSILSSSGGVI